MERLKARKKQREKQQGLGRPIISTFSDGHRVVEAGDAVYKSKNWKTFHDFLLYYIEKTLGFDWTKAESRKDFLDRHPIV